MQMIFYSNNIIIDTIISYPLVLISRGTLPGAENGEAMLEENGNILFTWADNTGTGTAKASDKVILVAYSPGLRQMVYHIGPATRSAGRAILAATVLRGFSAHTWIGFLNTDEKNAANSVYVGEIEQ